MNRKRTVLSTVTGAVLGLLCIAGVGMRHGFTGNALFLFATWYNRVVIGFVVGIAGSITILNSRINRYLRGFLIGTFISTGLYLSTGMRDLPSLFAGMAYGVVIDVVATKYTEEENEG